MAEDLPPSTYTYTLLLRIMSKRRTWVALFVLVYAILLSSSWNLLKLIFSWYQSSTAATPQPLDPQPPSAFLSSTWPALYASVLLGAVFGLLSMAAALSVAVPATVVTWITVLVLLTFCGKPRKALVAEGRKITAEIAGFAVKILLKEGNFVAAICAVLGYIAIFRRNGDGDYWN